MNLLRHRGVQLTAAAWIAASAAVVVFAGDTLPFQRPLLAGMPVTAQLVNAWAAMLLALVLMGITVWLTRGRDVPDIAARAPRRVTARNELVGLLAWGVAGQVGGWALGHALGDHAISLHLPGTLYGLHEHLSGSWVVAWASYNFVVYALVPYLWFRRRGYSHEAMSLRSSNRRADLRLILVILAIEAAAEIGTVSHAIFGLSAGQLAVGLPLAFGLNFVGTVLPVMVYGYALLLPRYLALTGSATTAVILGGVTYTALHLFEGWAVYDSTATTALSLVFLFLQYLGPGMVKSVLTLRTGNAWVHVWAYHAIAPHVTIDTVHIVHGLRL